MEIARLILDFLKVLVWPLAALLILFVFRDEVAGLSKRMRTLKVPGVDAEFSAEIEQVSAEVKAAVLNGPRRPPTGPPSAPLGWRTEPQAPQEERVVFSDPLLAIAHDVPLAGIMAAWQQVEMALLDVAPAEMRGHRADPSRVIASLDDLPDDIVRSLNALRRLREEAARADPEQPPSEEAAVKYFESCQAMVSWLRHYQQTRGQRASD